MTGPSSASITRRTALLITGATATVALSACAPKVRPLADSSASGSSSSSPSAASSSSASASSKASASASSGKSYKGPLKFDNYEKNGTYVPATETEKAKNVPKPLPPSNMHDPSVDGIYSFLGYWIASINYLLLTGDSEPLSKSDQDYVEIFQRFSDMYQDKSGWMYGSDAPMGISLSTDTPTQKSSGSNPRYRWNGRLILDQNLKIYLQGRGSNTAFTAESHDVYIDMTYRSGGWTVITKDTSDDDSGSSGSSSSSPSPSSKSPKSGSGKSGGLNV